VEAQPWRSMAMGCDSGQSGRLSEGQEADVRAPHTPGRDQARFGSTIVLSQVMLPSKWREFGLIAI